VARHCGCNNGRAAIIKLMQSSYPTSQAYTTARERWKCFCMGFPNLHVAAYLHCLEEAGVSQIYFPPAVEGSEVLWFAHAGWPTTPSAGQPTSSTTIEGRPGERHGW
jgi:hypothetical protein